MKTIIVACAGGIATSATIASKINRDLEDRGYGSKAKAKAINIANLDMYMNTADIYVSIVPFEDGQYPIPTFNGIPFITGIGSDEVLEKIINVL
ncbi:MAG: PTS sugar transporter subunit IIB [Eubacteriales bacterium]